MPPQITDTTLLVRPDRAVAQRERELAEQEAAPAEAAAAGSSTVNTASGCTGTDVDTVVDLAGRVPVPGSGSMVGPFTTSGSALPASSGPRRSPGPPEHPLSSARSASTRNATAATSTGCTRRSSNTLPPPRVLDLEITVEITASKKDGFPDDKTRIVSENARTLKFDQFGFEDH
jgi:hypothetical protein